MKVGLFHPGTQHSWQTARALAQQGALGWFATSIFYQPDQWPYYLERYAPEPLKSRLHAEFMRFHHPGVDPSFVRTFGFHEWAERFFARCGWRRLAQSCNALGNAAFGRSIGRLMAREPVDCVWGYDTAAKDCFEIARKSGKYCILDRTIGDMRTYNRLMLQAYEEFPEFFKSRDFLISDERIALEDKEYDLANSDFGRL